MLEINNRKKFRKVRNMWKLTNTLKQLVSQKNQSRKIRKYFEIIGNENKMNLVPKCTRFN